MRRRRLAAATFIPLVIACAPLAQAQEYTASPEQVSLVDQTCTRVLGLERGQTYFAGCQASLSNILAARNEGQAMAAAYTSCSRHGLAEGAAAFSTCVLGTSKPVAATPQSLAIASTGGPETEAGKSFYEVAPHVRWNRERYACAQLGLLPGGTLFGQCVAGLEAAFLPKKN
jgi:hypothetical protein